MQPKVTFLPQNKTIAVRPGTTLLTASKLANVHIRTRCGGNASCLMCKVIVEDQSGISPMKLKEETMLGSLLQQGYRLSCQAQVFKNTQAALPEDPLKAAIRRRLAEQQDDDF